MSEEEMREFREKVSEGIDRARYNLIREKALHDDIIIESDDNGGVKRIPARQLLRELYGEEVVTIVKASERENNAES